ncbi:MAG: oligopeptide/dipeptide ABC transporter ATP-binding protein [Streptosporangiales bacterium]
MPTKPERLGGTVTADDSDTLMSIRDVAVHYALRGGVLSRLFGIGTGTVRAVDGVDIELRKGEVLGVVGESGSGKTTLGRALLGLVRPTAGQIVHRGTDMARLSERELRRRRRSIQMIFQDPHAALNPTMDLETQVGHPLVIHGIATSAAERRRRVAEAFERVGLSPVERFLTKYPSDLSGGQKQRAVIARAIILDPEMLVADEPVSMLDMSVRAKILELMLDLKRQLDLTYVYITHDLATAKFFCDRVAIMYLGRVVEIGDTAEIFAHPKHPYTRSLLGAIPEPDPDKSVPRDLPRGEVPDAASPPLGCSFHPRCPRAFEICGWERRDLHTILEQHWLSFDPSTYESERALVANVDDLNVPGEEEAVLKPGHGRTGGDIVALLDKIREEDPEEPFWRGVDSIDEEADGVHVRFHRGKDPGLRPAAPVDVACHLYPEPGDAR